MKIERVVKTITLGKTVIVDDLEQSVLAMLIIVIPPLLIGALLASLF